MATGRMGVAYVVEVYPQGSGALRVDGVLFGGPYKDHRGESLGEYEEERRTRFAESLRP
jgi:hypothetical protein